MIDRLFTAVLTFTALIGGTFAMGTAWFESRTAVSQQMVMLPAVHVVAKRVMPRGDTIVASIDVEQNRTPEGFAERLAVEGFNP